MDNANGCAKPGQGEGSRYLAHFERGWFLLERKDYDAARKAAAEMASIRPHRFDAAELYGEIEHAECNYVESLRWYEKAIALRPGHYHFYCRAADIALYAIRDAERSLYFCREGLKCPEIPSLRMLAFVVMESESLAKIGRRDEAAARLATLDDHPAIRAIIGPSSAGHVTILAELDAEEDGVDADRDDLLCHFLGTVGSIGRLWLTLGSDQGAPLVRSALLLYPELRFDVEKWVRPFNLDDGRRAAHGLPACSVASAPTATQVWARIHDAVVRFKDLRQARNRAASPPTTPALGYCDDMGLLESLHSDLRRAQADQEVTLLVQVLRGRINDLTFGDLRQILNSRLGEGLAARHVSDLVAGTDPAPAVNASVSSTGAAAKSTKQRPSPTGTASKKSAKGKSRRKATALRSQPTPGAPATPPKVSAVTVAGREKYDSAVLQFLRERGGWHPSGFVRAHVGGSKVQIRGAMLRLEDAGLVERKGNFASTQYLARPPA